MFTSTSVVNFLTLTLIIAVGTPSSLTATTSTSLPVVNKYAIQYKSVELECDVLSDSNRGDTEGIECTWWQNDKELNRSSKYNMRRNEFMDELCYITINYVQENPDAQPTDYRCRDGVTVGRITLRLWLTVKSPVNRPVVTVGGQALADGGTLNLTALSHLHPPPIIQCSTGLIRPAVELKFGWQEVELLTEQKNNWMQVEQNQSPGHLFETNARMLVNDTQLIAGRTLSCEVCEWPWGILWKSTSISIIGKLDSLTTNSTISVKNEYSLKNSKAYFECNAQSAFQGDVSNGTGCTWWQNDKELNRSSKYVFGRQKFGKNMCSLTIYNVQEKPDAQPTNYRCRNGDKLGQVIRLWLEEGLSNPPVITVGTEALADGGVLNLTTLSHLHPPPVIQCSIGPTRPAVQLKFQLLQFDEVFIENEMDWQLLEISPMSGHFFNNSIRMLVNDTHLVAGQTLSCEIIQLQCEPYMHVMKSPKIAIVGKYDRTTPQQSAATNTKSAVAVILCGVVSLVVTVVLFCSLHTDMANTPKLVDTS